ncbi:MAG: peptidase and domain protein [Candidatus Saccharibacteria bacterium]|nr:peptidase and domain protein [Candidatus Saccharibacteria bacterium]
MHDHLEPMANGQEPTGVSIHSGFPNPAADSQGRPGGLALDLNQLLVQHPSSTYLFRISGHHWAEQGIFDGDIAMIDRALSASPHDIVLIWLDDNFELHRRNRLTENQHIWGVVSAIIHPRNKGSI